MNIRLWYLRLQSRLARRPRQRPGPASEKCRHAAGSTIRRRHQSRSKTFAATLQLKMKLHDYYNMLRGIDATVPVECLVLSAR